MKSSDDNRLIPCFIVGVGLGLLVGLFWAPRVGKETRDKLRHGADEGLAYLRQEAARFGGCRFLVGSIRKIVLPRADPE